MSRPSCGLTLRQARKPTAEWPGAYRPLRKSIAWIAGMSSLQRRRPLSTQPDGSRPCRASPKADVTARTWATVAGQSRPSEVVQSHLGSRNLVRSGKKLRRHSEQASVARIALYDPRRTLNEQFADPPRDRRGTDADSAAPADRGRASWRAGSSLRKERRFADGRSGNPKRGDSPGPRRPKALARGSAG